MAEEGKRGRRGHPIKGSNRAGQLRALYAKGVLSSGKGHRRGGKRVGYHPERGRALGRYAKASKSATAGGNLGRNVPRGTQKAAARRSLGHNHNTNAAKSHPSLAKSGIGMKAAHLRKGAGEGRKVPGQAERDATRAERIRKGRDKFQDWADPYGSRLRRGTRAPRTERAQQFMERVEKDKYWHGRGGAADPKKGTRAAAAAYKREREDARLVKTPGALAGLPRAKRIARARQIVATERKVVEAIRNREESKANKLYADMQRQTKYRARPRDWAATTKRLMRFLPG